MTAGKTKPMGTGAAQRQAGPSPKLAAFLLEALESFRAGRIGRDVAVDTIRAYPALRADEIAMKARALRLLATMPAAGRKEGGT